MTETELERAVSESLCHRWGTLNIPGGLSETERVPTVSEWKCGETGGHTRSAVFLVVLNVVLAVGNQHVFKGPDDLNGNGYFCALVFDRGGSPGKHRRGVRVVVRPVAFFLLGLKRA